MEIPESKKYQIKKASYETNAAIAGCKIIDYDRYAYMEKLTTTLVWLMFALGVLVGTVLSMLQGVI